MEPEDRFAHSNDSSSEPAIERPATEKRLERRIDPKLARQVNQRVNELSLAFVAVVDEETEGLFLCECGCGEFLEMLASDYDAGGWALLPGHAE